MALKVGIYPLLLAHLFICLFFFALAEPSTMSEEGDDTTSTIGTNGNNSTNDGGTSVHSTPQNDTRGPHGVRDDKHPAPEKEEEPNYRNPFSYMPKPFVFTMIFIGAFLLMIFVLGVVTVTRSYLCPRYGRFVDSHPRLKEVMPKWHLPRAAGRKSCRRQSATESHLELPKQDSLDNITTEAEISCGVGEMDNESFLASLENVNFSVTPPSTRRNNFSSSLVRSSLQPQYPTPHPAPFPLPPVHHALSNRGDNINHLGGVGAGGVMGRDSRYMYPPVNRTNSSRPFAVSSVTNVDPDHNHGSLYL